MCSAAYIYDEYEPSQIRDDWDEAIYDIRLVLNCTVHSSTGFTPLKLFRSLCEDVRLPHELIYGKAKWASADCMMDHVHLRQLMTQQITEAALKRLGLSALAQTASRERAGFRIRKYTIGKLVYRWWPPGANDKIYPFPFLGPYPVLDVNNFNNTVLLNVPKAGRGGAYVMKWINMANIKPKVELEDGSLFIANSPCLM